MLDSKDPGYLADLIAQNIALRHMDKQAILEELSPMVRPARLLNDFWPGRWMSWLSEAGDPGRVREKWPRTSGT